jgi:hypothetical protein
MGFFYPTKTIGFSIKLSKFIWLKTHCGTACDNSPLITTLITQNTAES